MGGLFKWLRSLVAWRVVRHTGVWCYWRNDVTGARKITRQAGGHQPRDDGWLKTGQWTPRGEPPRGGGTGVRHGRA